MRFYIDLLLFKPLHILADLFILRLHPFWLKFFKLFLVKYVVSLDFLKFTSSFFSHVLHELLILLFSSLFSLFNLIFVVLHGSFRDRLGQEGFVPSQQSRISLFFFFLSQLRKWLFHFTFMWSLWFSFIFSLYVLVSIFLWKQVVNTARLFDLGPVKFSVCLAYVSFDLKTIC